jgi:hypothetical protein
VIELEVMGQENYFLRYHPNKTCPIIPPLTGFEIKR